MNLLLCGATGYGNVGDDCIRDILADSVYSKFGDKVNITATRPYPQKKLIEESNLIVIGGGGLIYDSNQANFDYYLMYAAEAYLESKPYAFIGIGLQELSDPKNISRLREAFRHSKVISVRQQADIDKLKKLDCYFENKTFLGKDIGYLIKPSKIKFTEKSNKPKIAIIPGHDFLNTEIYKDKIKLAVLNNMNAVDFYFISTSYEDNDNIEELRKIIDYNGSIRDFKYFRASTITSLLGEMDAVYTNRFHGVVFGVASGCKKVIGFGTKQKILDELPQENIATSFSEGFLNILNTCKEIPFVKDRTHLNLLNGLISSMI